MKWIELIKTVYSKNKELFKDLREQRDIHRKIRDHSVQKLYKEIHADAGPCFVLSTGRCGTKLLTNLLTKSDKVKAYHEPVPELTYYSKFAYNQYPSNSDLVSRIVDACRYEYIRNAYLLDKHYIETNNRITFFCHALKELYPRSKFIHLIRKPEEFIASGLARDWYSGNVLYDEARIEPENIEMSQVEKIAWLWNETNQFIEDFKKKIEDDKVITINSNQLFNNPSTTNRIFRFLGLDTLPKYKIDNMLKRPVNKQDKKGVDKRSIDDSLLKDFTPLRKLYF